LIIEIKKSQKFYLGSKTLRPKSLCGQSALSLCSNYSISTGL